MSHTSIGRGLIFQPFDRVPVTPAVFGGFRTVSCQSEGLFLTDHANMYDQLVAGDITPDDIESSGAFATIKDLINEKASHETERTTQL